MAFPRWLAVLDLVVILAIIVLGVTTADWLFAAAGLAFLVGSNLAYVFLAMRALR